MKLTIEPTDEITESRIQHPKVEITVPFDDLHISEMMSNIRCLLLGWGYAESTIDQYLTLE